MTYLILGEENAGGFRGLRKLTSTDDLELAKGIFEALMAGETYEHIYLVKVIDER